MDFPIRMDLWRIIEKKFCECEQFETFSPTRARAWGVRGVRAHAVAGRHSTSEVQHEK